MSRGRWGKFKSLIFLNKITRLIAYANDTNDGRLKK